MAESQLGVSKEESKIVCHATCRIDEFFYSQMETAKYLELAYLQLRDHPEVAEKVLETARASLSQHRRIIDLFDIYRSTASLVVKIYCPIMMKAVEKKDRNIICQAFKQFLDVCGEMKKQTEEVRDSYKDIYKLVEQIMSEVNKMKKQILTEVQMIEQTQKDALVFREEEERRIKELKEEEEELQEREKTLKEHRDQLLHQAGPPSGIKGGFHTVIDFVMAAAALISDRGQNVMSAYWKRQSEQAQQALHTCQEANAHLASTIKEKKEVTEKVEQKTKQSLAMSMYIEAKEMEKGTVGTKKILTRTTLLLSNANLCLLKMGMFWDGMATMVNHLYQEQNAYSIILQQIEDEYYAEQYKDSIRKTERDWDQIENTCSTYVEKNRESIFKIYYFLVTSLDDMTEDAIEERKRAIVKEIKADTEEVFSSA